jgi:DNA-binding NarL/FixJ family response regulator
MKLVRAKRVFIIDDDALMSEALFDYLVSNGSHEVHKFNTGEDCFRYEGAHPDFIILDYYLNSSNKDAANGMEVLPAIKKYYPKSRIIMLSGQEKYAVAMKSIQKGAEQYVVKGQGSFEKIAAIINESN